MQYIGEVSGDRRRGETGRIRPGPRGVVGVVLGADRAAAGGVRVGAGLSLSGA